MNSCNICASPKIRPYGDATCIKHFVPVGVDMKRSLYKCEECRSITIFPVPGPDVLQIYYNNYGSSQVDAQSWNNRLVTRPIRRLAESIGSGKVLDIGCGNGSLLDLLPSSLEKFGVELSQSAANQARKKGIKVSCAPWEFAEFEGQFDLIIALDFLEHVRNPWLSFKKMADSLRTGGRLVIETGNADSLVARTLKDDWSYMAVWGHLGGLSAKALIAYSEKANIKVLKIIKGKHCNVALGRMLYRGLLAYGLRGTKLILSFLGNDKFKKNLFYNICNRVPIPAEFPDHMILIGQKNNNN